MGRKIKKGGQVTVSWPNDEALIAAGATAASAKRLAEAPVDDLARFVRERVLEGTSLDEEELNRW